MWQLSEFVYRPNDMLLHTCFRDAKSWQEKSSNECVTFKMTNFKKYNQHILNETTLFELNLIWNSHLYLNNNIKDKGTRYGQQGEGKGNTSTRQQWRHTCHTCHNVYVVYLRVFLWTHDDHLSEQFYVSAWWWLYKSQKRSHPTLRRAVT